MRMTKSHMIHKANEGARLVQTIAIREEDGVWFATSEDEPTLFVSAPSRPALYEMLAGALHALNT